MSVLYLYGFVPADTELPERGLLGVGEVPVDLVAFDGFAAAVARPDPGVYSAEALEPRTGDLEWMAEQGLRHEQVVAWFVDHATIIPSRLLTLFSSEDALRRAVGPGEAIRADLDRLGGTREWDLKVAWDPVRIAAQLGEISEEIGALDRQIAEATPGKRFLLERKRKDAARTEGRIVARRLAEELLDDLRGPAREVEMLPPPKDDTPVVLNAALLLPAGEEEAVLARAAEARARLAEVGLTVAFTGPWAPYRFMESSDG